MGALLTAYNSTVRKTRGILDATRTNVITNAQPKPLTEAMVLDLLQKVWESGGIQVSETATIMCGATQRRALTNEFITTKNYRDETRNVGGVSVDTIITDFGRLNGSGNERQNSMSSVMSSNTVS